MSYLLNPYHATMKKWVVILCFFMPLGLTAQNFDIDLLKEINPQNPGSDYWRATSSSAYWLSGTALVGSLAFALSKHDKKIERNTYGLLFSIAAGTVITQGLKEIIDRPRPADSYPLDIFPYKATHRFSMPSGHTTLAFSTAAALSFQYKKWYVVVPAFLWAGSVGYSRMYLGVHYPSDVLAGAAVGIGSAFISKWLTKKLIREKNISSF